MDVCDTENGLKDGKPGLPICVRGSRGRHWRSGCCASGFGGESGKRKRNPATVRCVWSVVAERMHRPYWREAQQVVEQKGYANGVVFSNERNGGQNAKWR